MLIMLIAFGYNRYNILYDGILLIPLPLISYESIGIYFLILSIKKN